MTECSMQNSSVPPELLGRFRETRIDSPEMADQLAEDGYLFLRGAIDTSDIAAARAEVFGRLAEVGEIAEPAIDGIFTGTSRRKEIVGDLGAFWQSVSEGSALRAASHGKMAKQILTAIFGEPARPHDYIFLRPGVPGRSTRLHYDYPFFARGSQRILTVWTALGDIDHDEGPLAVVEGSHRFDDLIEPVQQIDYESNDSPTVQVMSDPVEFVRQRGSKLLTANFQAGDIVVFTMTTLHGTLDNRSPTNRTRLSCDVRWQPAAEEIDPRYAGPNPAGTTGAGYGELNGAKPLTLDWHTR